jgi:putative transposase
MRLEADRRGITLPVIGTLRSKQHTRRVERHVRKGNALTLSMTPLERWARLFVSVQYAVRTPVVCASNKASSRPDLRAGVDLGLRHVATIVDSEGGIERSEDPKPLRKTLTAQKRAHRELNRRIPGSRVGGKRKPSLLTYTVGPTTPAGRPTTA